MPQFFDLSIPYLERSAASAAENKARKDARLRATVRAMELGYAGVAYDRPFRGVMSDADRCTIPPFPLSSLLASAPALASSASFHRGLVGAPLSSPFRQYSRLTVSVDSAAAASALNSGNPVLRTYDVVAARPLNQLAFDQACKVSEVDVIAIDFSQKLPFRLKLPVVAAATERGVYFEITYSPLIVNVHVRRQMLSEAKLLVDWTRGKNLIISSAATAVSEIRGPNDVTNLFVFLLGLSIERAKAAISGNCRSLVANALRKKHCYKEAIRIERIIPDDKLGSKRPWFGDCNDFDPISSGEGDLPPLDDMAKFFSGASKIPKSSTRIAFISDVWTENKEVSEEDNSLLLSQNAAPFSFTRELDLSAAAHEVRSASTNGISRNGIHTGVPVEDHRAMIVKPVEHKTFGCKFGDLVSPRDTMGLPVDAKEADPVTADSEDIETVDECRLFSVAAGMPSDATTLKNCDVVGEDNIIMPVVGRVDVVMPAVGQDNTTMPGTILTDLHVNESIMQCNMCVNDTYSDVNFTVSAPIEAPHDVMELVKCQNTVSRGTDMEEDLHTEEIVEMKDHVLIGDNTTMEVFVTLAPSEQGEGEVSMPNAMLFKNDFHKMKEEVQPKILTSEKGFQVDDVLMKIEDQLSNGSAAADKVKHGGLKTGKGKHKERSAHRLPFKGLLKPMLFKKKFRRLKR